METLQKCCPGLPLFKNLRMTPEEKIVYLTKVINCFPDDDSSQDICATFMESVNRKVTGWHEFPTNSLSNFKSAVIAKFQELCP